MKEWIINGGRELTGTIRVSGAKNALLAIIPACVITKSIITLKNIPPLYDTYMMIKILEKLNVKVIYDNKCTMIIDSRGVKNATLKGEEIKKIRASYYFMGALISLYRQVKIATPGGCKFANRPIDLHLYAFDKLGYKCTINDGIYELKKNKVKESVIEFKKVSVGATINAILASCKTKGKVTLINVALEPEIDDLINFLNCCGAKISRKNNTIVVIGVSSFKGCEYTIMQDRIEAGTHLIIGACLGTNLKIAYKEIYHLTSLINLLKEMGAKIMIDGDGISISKLESIEDQKIIFDVYPALPTDLQQPLSILLTKTEHLSVLRDNVYPSRYTQLTDLRKMGFKMRVYNGCLLVNKSDSLFGNSVSCKDLRGGISLVIAGLVAKGETRIVNVEHIERGYENIISKLQKTGASIYEKA